MIVPFAFVASTCDPMLAFVDRLLVHTFVTVGLIGLVGLVYFFVVVGLGRVPEDSERSVLGLSMVAAGLAAILALPARRRLEEFANQRVYGERRAPDDALRTFATRMSRVVPMDELLLQLAESLRKTMALTAAEIWTGADGTTSGSCRFPTGETPISRSPARSSPWWRGPTSRGTRGSRCGCRRCSSAEPDPRSAWPPSPTSASCWGSSCSSALPMTPPSATTRTRCSPTWPGRSGSPCTTSASTRPCRRRSTS